MTLKFIALLTLLFCCPVVFAEPLASASYKDVCEQMDQQGISSRTQSDPSSQQLVDNVVVVVLRLKAQSNQETTKAAPGNEHIPQSNMVVLGTRWFLYFRTVYSLKKEKSTRMVWWVEVLPHVREVPGRFPIPPPGLTSHVCSMYV